MTCAKRHLYICRVGSTSRLNCCSIKCLAKREKALDVYYRTLDKAIESNDRELIVAAIQGISTIVTKTPLEDLERLAQLYNDSSAPLLDF